MNSLQAQPSAFANETGFVIIGGLMAFLLASAVYSKIESLGGLAQGDASQRKNRNLRRLVPRVAVHCIDRADHPSRSCRWWLASRSPCSSASFLSISASSAS